VGQRIRGLILVAVLLVVGVFVGSAISQWNPLPKQERPEELTREEVLRGRSVDLGIAELGKVRVQVLNAGGRSGMAREATRLLRDLGFDVVEYGNSEEFGRDSTLVVDRSGRSAAARAVARALGGTRIEEDVDPNLYLDVTVLLGEEWEPDRPISEPVTRQGYPWWDVRRFFLK
jgi:LytR cell envelope-related transcriptional attenuator